MPIVQTLTQKSLDSGRVERIEFRVVTPMGATREIVMDGSFIRFISAVEPDDLPAFAALRECLQRDGQGGPLALRVRRPTGERRHILMSARLMGADGVAGSIVDITDRIHLEAQLRQAQKMDALGRMAGGIAHDFNNLLTVILGNASDLLGEAPNNELLAEVVTAAEQAATVTRQLLAFSRNSVIKLQPLVLSEVIPRALTLIRRVIGPDVRIVYETDVGLWSIIADEGQLVQILMNLVLNARDALPEGGMITIEARNVPGASRSAREPKLDVVSLTVCDNGVGMTGSLGAAVLCGVLFLACDAGDDATEEGASPESTAQ